MKSKYSKKHQNLISHQGEILLQGVSIENVDTLTADSSTITMKQDVIDMGMAKCVIIKCDLSLNLVESSVFHEFMIECNLKGQ